MTAEAKATDLLTGFPPALRLAGLSIDPSRAADFLRSVRLCRLRDIGDLRRVGRLTLTSSPDDFSVFDETFDAWFANRIFAGKVDRVDPDDGPRTQERGGHETFLQQVSGANAGQAAAAEVLRNRKNFGKAGDIRAQVSRLERAFDSLPTLERRAWLPSPSGPRIDVARTLRAARRTFGETLRLFRQARPQKHRKLLLLVDVSGSMKVQSEAYLRFAHIATRRVRRVETFCFGTRLSRVTSVLRHRDADEALSRLSRIVLDFDGGTQIGRSLEEFLSISRYAALVRGAITIILSDGLERGDPAAMIHAVARLARLSHRLLWATPLAADPKYRPATRGMAGVLPHLDGLFDGDDLRALAGMLGKLDRIERSARGGAARLFERTGS